MVKVSVAQMNSQDDVKANLKAVSALVAQAQAVGSKLILLPENFAFIGDEIKKATVAEEAGNGLIQDTVASLAAKHKIWILAGTVPVKDSKDVDKVDGPKKAFAASMLYDDLGNMVCRYDKIHLFDVMINNRESFCESSSILPGCSPKVYKCPFGTIGFSVCYDVRFPELYRVYSAAGVDILSVPAAFVYETGKAHWEVLNRARAIENQAFVLAANQCGYHPGPRRSFGHSMIVNPWGEVLGLQASEPGLVSVDLDLTAMHKLRNSFPVIKHRKLG